MDKPRIIILMHYLELGGAEMALIGLLHALDPKKVDVDLFIYSHQGPLMKFIPEWVNLLPEVKSYSVIEKPMKEALIRGHLGVVVGRLLAKYKSRRFLKKHYVSGETYNFAIQYVADCVTPWLTDINPKEEYDLCISFLAPHNIGVNKVRACKKICWIHTDYSTVNIDFKSELKVWGKYDYIASISPQVTEAFTLSFPSLSNKIIEIENILPTDYIHRRSKEFDASKEYSGSINLLSIGRFCTAKNYDNVPDIVSRIIDAGITNLKWYIIGAGVDENLIRSKIKEAKMEDHVILLGMKENPYPYIKACDIYVQPSRYEGKSVTVREAQILGKPVAVTAYKTASSQINNGVDGVIVPLDNDGCAKALVEFINDKEKQKSLQDFCETGDFANMKEVEKIYSLLNY